MTDLDYVRDRLNGARGEWNRIARESGVARRAIGNLMHREGHDPRWQTVNALANWFRRQAKERAAA